MENLLEGWELVLDHDGGEKTSSPLEDCCMSSSSSSSSSLEEDELDNSDKNHHHKKKDEDEYEYPVSTTEFVDLESAAEATLLNKDEEDQQETKDQQPQPQRGGGGFDIWKWRLTGLIGALCSFGVATACVLVLGEAPKGGNRNNRSHGTWFNFKGYEQNQRLVAAVRGGGSLHVPFITAAHITFGGYVYDGDAPISHPQP